MTRFVTSWLLLAIAAAVSVLAIRLVFFRPHEPVYHGRPVTYFTEHLSGREFEESYDAIRAIGAEGVPWLLNKARSAHGFKEEAYAAVWPTIPTGLQRRLRPPVNSKAVDEKVAYALSLLKSDGVPTLITVFRDRQSSIRRIAATAIGRMLLTDQIVAQSVPALSQLLADPDESVRVAAIEALEKMGPGAKAAIPALVEMVGHANPASSRISGPRSRRWAVRLLAMLGPDAKSAVPELTRLLQARDRYVRSEAAVALWRIQQNTNMLTVLTAELEEGGGFPFFDVVTALGEMGPAAKPAAPLLVQKLGPPQGLFSRPDTAFILSALEKIDRATADRVRSQVEDSRQMDFIRRILAERAAR